MSALAKPRAVTYFLGYDNGNPAEPYVFYLRLLREGSALGFDRPELAPPTPAPVRP